MFRAAFTHAEDIVTSIKTFWFEPERTVRYAAGQYLDVRVPHASPDRRGMMRTMSLSSAPTEKLLGITTKIERTRSTFKQALLGLAPGDEVTMTDPMGDFVLPKQPGTPLIFVAGGVGITPVRSMVKWLLDTGAEPRDMQLIYIVRSPDEMPYLPLLTACPGLRITPVYTRTAPAGQPVHQRLDAAKLLELINDTGGGLIYLSGPEPMMDGYWRDLQSHGIPRERLVLDYFTGLMQL
jgi:ferredoxin-NADP reductase